MSGTESGVDEQVQKCLERVAISRVFDIEGLWEVIGEVGHPVSLASEPVFPGHDAEDGNGIRNGNGHKKEVTVSKDEIEVVVEKDIADDEPEIQDSEDDLTPPVPPAAGRMDHEEDSSIGVDEGTEIIIVDNMTHVINELFARKEKSDGMFILLSFLFSSFFTHSFSFP